MNTTKFLYANGEKMPSSLANALAILANETCVQNFDKCITFKEVKSQDIYSKVTKENNQYFIEYSTLSSALRALGNAISDNVCEEHTPFERVGIMLDVSRNMVMKVEHFKKWLRFLALCGCNQVQLYCEDTYKLDDEPFFGIYRAPYTLEELQEMDQYANLLGIELIGCIQTLAHLEQILQHQAYANIRDNDKIMLVDLPETEALIRKMISFWSKALKSRRLHVGMDEAHGLGRGRYQTLHGPESESSLMTRHLKLVSSIAKEYNLHPMMWSDMFFRMTNSGHVYYDFDSPFPKGIEDQIDKDTILVYWDYYHKDQESYRKMIARHRDLGKDPYVASGIWTWSRMWYDHQKTMETAIPCIEVCRQEKIKELSFTMWGDDGAYCHYDSSIAGIFRCTDLAFGEQSEDVTSKRFNAICNSNYFAQVAVGNIHGHTGTIGIDDSVEIFPAMVLWDDPLLGIYYSNCKCANNNFDTKYINDLKAILEKILPYKEDNLVGKISYAITLINTLIKKLETRSKLEKAYQLKDSTLIKELITQDIPTLIDLMANTAENFRTNWLECAKGCGMERIQIRFAGQIARLEELKRRLNDFLTSSITVIDELENPLPRNLEPQRMNFYVRVSSGSNHF